jgi:hypothetical protein
MPNRFDNPPHYLESGDPEKESSASMLYPGQIGMRFTIVQPSRTAAGVEEGRSKTYQRVKTDSTMSVAPFKGAVAWWSDQAQYLVTTSPTALGRGRVAGVFQNTAANPITVGHYTCIQVGGPAIVKFVDAVTSTPDASGKLVIPSATAGKADCLAAGSAATYPILGRSAGTYDAVNAECVVDLDVPVAT